MKLLTFKLAGTEYLGALTDTGVFNLSAAAPEDIAFSSMQHFIEAGQLALDRAYALLESSSVSIPSDQVDFLAPLPLPPQIRDCLGFEEHLKNSFESAMKLSAMAADDPVVAERELRASGRFTVPEVWYQQPLYYKANRFSVAESGKDVVWPAYSEVMDFELEMACIVGKKGKDISKVNAEDHIFGYTIYNDFSARDAQILESPGMLGPAKSKDFDDSIILGPVIVTKDELDDPYSLRMQARVNGETWCDSNSSTIHWKFSDMIAHISKSETLHPGEVIGSGTVGFGCGLEHLRFLNDGDIVELEVEKIGVISNKVTRQ
ncbi:fumarylacetoacetate hydrolase family protein [Pseudomonadales bacterium]|jgi:2-keto-4-pentenoate hydratase/2-oxohepta-3-ene-1,7-dioic acid hydratase in catechol pathway|nr:fumarylacetoacetate hydrolase family protein [Gammaproteobacteria bacterium]MDA7726094.1 fumarylacetoacetate hydrolase family protein [Pseudomonadales bacterium]MDC1016835.1 fumarylacetoacetate hydrolase family protein [Pseudomonadales bacterium]MDC1480528.1 fumarylacetoacetate hydrolase family protein [Pseudomonadales bacterium]|tara:strand:+ start:373 stop:1329 length:957 start_codon:yes stop_codon:yes gene_type:complete